MILKIFKVIWFFSLLVTAGVLLYVYASLPEIVALGDSDIPREIYFYIMLSFLALFNLFVFVLRKIYSIEAPWNIVAWFYGLVILLNLFFLVTLSFTSLINSGEKFDYVRIGPIIYGSLLLLFGWSLVWPTYLVVRRIRS